MDFLIKIACGMLGNRDSHTIHIRRTYAIIIQIKRRERERRREKECRNKKRMENAMKIFILIKAIIIIS